jgi:hypothetical protein
MPLLRVPGFRSAHQIYDLLADAQLVERFMQRKKSLQ